MEKSDSNKRLWEINEKIYRQKKELDEQLKSIEIEKEQLKIEAESIKIKNQKLWEQSELIHKEKERINILRLEIEGKHKEITDSIQYAQRLQAAILPQKKIIDNFLSSWFILFKPKDIVSGDFYWFAETEKKIIFAAADATGHGVPGAMVSVICNNGLNSSVKEFRLEDPGEILTKTREIIIESFEKSSNEIKDGMDIALVSMNKYPNKDGSREISYAGAYNPLWIFRKQSLTIEEVKADRQPVGKYEFEKPFTTHKRIINKGDKIYLFSDGYESQFGGEKGKKLKASNFKKYLKSLSNKSMDQQKILLEKFFKNWIGNLEQVDDLVIFGVEY